VSRRWPAVAAICAGIAAAVAVAAAPAHADGDPCSDFLLSQSLCVPLNRPAQSQINRVQKTLDYAAKKGFLVRVAVIASKQDLGSNPEYFGLPEPYAKLLAAEVQFAYKGRILTIMQKGYGIRNHNKPDATEAKVLGHVAKPTSDQPDGLMVSANEAIRKLAAASGVHVPNFKVVSSGPPVTTNTGGSGGLSAGSGTSTRTFLLLLAGGLVVLAAVIGGILFWPAREGEDAAGE
jgi:hypothetical protein